jgi:hypothetical protein
MVLNSDLPIPTSAFGLFPVPAAPLEFNGLEYWVFCHGRSQCLDQIGNVKRPGSRYAGVEARSEFQDTADLPVQILDFDFDRLIMPTEQRH